MRYPWGSTPTLFRFAFLWNNFQWLRLSSHDGAMIRWKGYLSPLQRLIGRQSIKQSMRITRLCWSMAGAPGNGFAFLMTRVSTDYTEIMILKETTKSWKIAFCLPVFTLPQVLLVSWLINQMSVWRSVGVVPSVCIGLKDDFGAFSVFILDKVCFCSFDRVSYFFIHLLPYFKNVTFY